MKLKIENEKLKVEKRFAYFPISDFRFPFFIVFLCVFCVAAVNFSCRSAPTDLRSLAPADTLVYLETNDLGSTLESLTENKAFAEIAAGKPDFSAVENVQFAVAVVGFETTEQQLADEQSILNFKPRFVAVADTHAWNRTAASIAETQIGKLARVIYGDDVKLEKSERADAKFFVWTSDNGRKIFSAVSGGVIYVGNDEKVLDECLKIRRGAAQSLLTNESLARARQNSDGENKINENRIAFGYVSSKGVEQIADFAGVSLAVGATESDDARSFIARVLPQIFRQSVKEISWTAEKSAQGIEDKISILTSDEIAPVFNETMKASAKTPTDAAEFLPSDVFSATVYTVENPQLAWRSLLFVAARQTSRADAQILAQFSGSLLAPYGVADAERFLSAIESGFTTAQFDGEGERAAAIFTVKDVEIIKKSIGEINFESKSEKFENAEIWKSEDGEFAAAFADNKLILGDAESIFKCLEAKSSGRNFTKNQFFQTLGSNKAAAALTIAKDADSAEKIVEVLSGATNETKKITTVYSTETRFTERGVERRSVSAFGFIGTILEQVKGER